MGNLCSNWTTAGALQVSTVNEVIKSGSSKRLLLLHLAVATLQVWYWGVSTPFLMLLPTSFSFQVTSGSFDPRLRDTAQFPSLYQVAQKDTSLALAMVSLMIHFRWTWVELLITEGQKSLQFLSDIKAEMDRNGVCVGFLQMISNPLMSYVSNMQHKNSLIKEPMSVNVVIIYYDSDGLNEVDVDIRQYLVTWGVWVTNSQWHADMAGRNFILDSFHGTLIVSQHHEEIPGFKNFVQTANPPKYPEDTYLTMYWFQTFHCSFSDSDCELKDCAPSASLVQLPVNRFDTAMSDGSYNIYNAVYAVAYALHAMLLQQGQRALVETREAMVFAPWQTPRWVCSESCNPGLRKSPREGKAACCFDAPVAQRTKSPMTQAQALQAPTAHMFPWGAPLLSVTSCVSSCQSLNLSVSHFPHLQDAGSKRSRDDHEVSHRAVHIHRITHLPTHTSTLTYSPQQTPARTEKKWTRSTASDRSGRDRDHGEPELAK
ncbi:PREDICTED: vomeronasal type-2 receptor 116-like [Chinchilla lanigera]|uniref:vomeronasal type-2 receptor 116-like n=1 Tax=Chinchilla lanigera TaxID=34839 RepID=UPI00069879BE|nr:PREDICTED: vomeronasal type-2 receptor 116-like [Chinchilla lanigera]